MYLCSGILFLLYLSLLLLVCFVWVVGLRSRFLFLFACLVFLNEFYSFSLFFTNEIFWQCYHRVEMLWHWRDVSHKHFYFPTVCTNVMLIGSLSGRGIIVHESRHSWHWFLLQDGARLLSRSKPHSLGERNGVVKCFWRNLSRHLKLHYVCRTSKSFPFLHHILFGFNIFMLSWPIMTLEVKAPLQYDTPAEVAGGTLKQNGQVGS